MTGAPGTGGTPDRPAGYTPPDQPGVAAGSPAVIRARQVIIVGSGGELLVYTPARAAGDLIASIAGAAGVDQSNNFVANIASYGPGFAAALAAGFVQFYTGSLAGGWSVSATIETNSLGDIILLAKAGRSVLTGNVTVDDGAGNMTVPGSLSVNGSTSTGAGDNGGVTSGPSGTVNAFPAAGPNHTHTEIHHHPL